MTKPLSPPHLSCPVDHTKLAKQKTSRESAELSLVKKDTNGDWHIYGFEEARFVLRSSFTRQAGFQADEMEKLPSTMRDPILFQEGETHREQRAKTARFFTPVTTDKNYRGFMEQFAEDALCQLKTTKKADLSELSLALAVDVAAHVVGLNNSRFKGMSSRLEAFFATGEKASNWFERFVKFGKNQVYVAKFFISDVQPAIAARKKAPKEDLISHLISEGYNATEILVECITFAAAGMITTREFISLCAWHFFENSQLRVQYLNAEQRERYRILHELLRLEPVVGHLYRRATEDFVLESQDKSYLIKARDRIIFHVYALNSDERIVGEAADRACPMRALPKGVGEAVMGFGDGHHRCPGAYIAIQESDIFLRKLFALEGLQMLKMPDLNWNELVKGYELRNFLIALN